MSRAPLPSDRTSMTAVRRVARKRKRARNASPPERTHPLVLAAVAAGLLAFAAAGWWGLSTREPVTELASMDEAIRIPGGELRVTSMRPEIMASMNGPGMSMPDMAPEGYRRFVVDIEVRGTSGSGVTYDPKLVRLEVPGLPPAPPLRAVNPSAVVGRGETLELSLLFQAPEAADSLALTYEGARQRVLLEGDLGAGHGHVEAGSAAPDFSIGMSRSRYSPARLDVPAGSTVRWRNDERAQPHTVTFDAGIEGSGLLSPGESFQAAFEEPGTYPYRCTIHPSMRGELIVVPR